MPPDTITVLLVSAQADEIMSTTRTLRSFYPGCRVETVYSLDESLEWAGKFDWHLVLLDASLLQPDVRGAVQEVRRRAPRSAVIILARHHDVAFALDMIRQGADYCLFRDTPSFPAELPFVLREILERRDLRTRLDFSQDRYLRLIETLVDIVYELDQKGRFVYVSSAVQSLLEYDPQELLGQHYSIVLSPDQASLAEHRFNERRSEARATRRLALMLQRKDRHAPLQPVELNATALYDRHGRFRGTVGVLRVIVAPEAGHRPERLDDLAGSLAQLLSTTDALLRTVQGFSHAAGLTPETRPTPGVDTPPQTPVRAPDSTEPTDAPASQIAVERRQSPRIALDMRAQVAADAVSWEGTALNMSLGGIYVVVKGLETAIEGQSVQLAFTSEVGVLEIPGIVRGIRRQQAMGLAGEKTPVTGLALQFSRLQEIEDKILQSLLDGLRTRSITVRLTVFLIGSDATKQSGQFRGTAERRLATRIQLKAPVLIDFDLPAEARSVRAVLRNISTGGACIEGPRRHDVVGRRLSIRFPAPAILPPPSGEAAEHRAGDDRLTGEVRWVEEARASAETPSRMGVQFMHDAITHARLAMLIDRSLAQRVQPPPASQASPMMSTPLECRNDRDQRIAMMYDHPAEMLPPGTPLIVLSPGYGEMKPDYIRLSFTMVINGFHGLRYDHTNHLGQSDGGMALTSLSSMADDLAAVIRDAHRRWPASPIVVMASNIAARVALKALARVGPITLLVLYAPIVNVQATLLAAHHEDIVGSAVTGAKRGISNILGFNIDADAWLADIMRNGYATLHTTLKDAAEMRIPCLMFSSAQDPWVHQPDVTRLNEALGERVLEWAVLPGPVYRMSQDQQTAAPLMEQVVSSCRMALFPLQPRHAVTMPSEQDIVRQTRMELERLRTHQEKGRANHLEFWRDYLDHAHYLVNFSDYWHLLDQTYRLLGPLGPHARVLDAGCGNGNFGMFLLITQSLRQKQTPAQVHYVGVDFILSGLTQAKSNVLRVAAELRGKFGGIVSPDAVMTAGLTCADLNVRLPFHNDAFDRIVCTLVLGYLRDPLSSLKELVRVLRPGGKIVLINFKPQADLSQLYRNFVSQAQDTGDLDQVKHLLEVSGKLAEYAGEGGCRGFDQQELAMLLLSGGASQPRVYSTFANQAYIAVAEKPA